MTIEQVIKENFPDVRISWACNSCVKNQMSLLLSWLTTKETKEAEAVKKKRNVRKKRTPKRKG